MTLIVSGCNLTNRLNTAASDIGKLSAGVNLPDQPEDCRKKEPHAAIMVGDELRSILVRKRGALDRANARGTRCASFYDDTKANFGTQSK